MPNYIPAVMNNLTFTLGLHVSRPKSFSGTECVGYKSYVKDIELCGKTCRR